MYSCNFFDKKMLELLQILFKILLKETHLDT